MSPQPTNVPGNWTSGPDVPESVDGPPPNQLLSQCCSRLAIGPPRAAHLIMAGVNTREDNKRAEAQSQCGEHSSVGWLVGINTVKTRSRCVATPGAHTTIFLWPQCRIAGQHNRLFLANCTKFNFNCCQNMATHCATQQDISVRFCEVATMYNYTTEYKW